MVDPANPAPASPWRVVGVTAVLFLFVGIAVWLGLGLHAAAPDPAAEQRALFGETAPPFGLVLEDAHVLPSKAVLVRFARSESGPGPCEALFLRMQQAREVDALFRAAEPGEMGAGGGGGGGGSDEGGETSSDPAKRLEEWEKDKAFDWHFTMRRDEVGWGEWRTKYLVERSFRKGDGWYEEARVDLRTKDRALVLFAHWPRETPVDERELETLLAAMPFPAPATK